MGRRELARQIFDRLATVIEAPETELEHEDPYELIVAVVLSAQCTDARVNMVTPDLFRAYPSVQRLAAAEPEEVFEYIRSVTFPNNKARHLVGLARRVVDVYDGAIPSTVAELQTLPGVGRKTALVVAAVAHGADTLAVDTHVFRTAHRLGLVRPTSLTPRAVEDDLVRLVPREERSDAHHFLILHGRYTCRARNPDCARCVVASLCRFKSESDALPEPVAGLDPGKGAYWCGARRHYFDVPILREDRHGTEQRACPRCGSTRTFDAATGRTLRRVRDPRATGPRTRP